MAALLPLTIDAYAMSATRVWLADSTASVKARRFARRNAIGAITASLVGNATYHAVAAGLVRTSWVVVVAVGAVPPVVLGLVSHLAVLRKQVDVFVPADDMGVAVQQADRVRDEQDTGTATPVQPVLRTEDGLRPDGGSEGTELMAAARSAGPVNAPQQHRQGMTHGTEDGRPGAEAGGGRGTVPAPQPEPQPVSVHNDRNRPRTDQAGSGSVPAPPKPRPAPKRTARPKVRPEPAPRPSDEQLLEAAKAVDARYRAEHDGRPVTRDALRKELRLGGDRATALLHRLREESRQGRGAELESKPVQALSISQREKA